MTAQVRRGGALNLYGGKADLMGVTHIAFDPYHPRRILVATRDAGIACSADGGRTWRTIYDSDKIQYITSLHFTPNGAVYISSYGQGLWQLKPATNCPKSYNFPWDDRRPFPGNVGDQPVLERAALPPPPKGIAAPDRPKLLLERIRDGEVLTISGRGFPPNSEIIFQSPVIGKLAASAPADAAGKLATKLSLPPELMPGTYAIEARGDGRLLTSADFHKPYGEDEEPERRGD